MKYTHKIIGQLVNCVKQNEAPEIMDSNTQKMPRSSPISELVESDGWRRAINMCVCATSLSLGNDFSLFSSCPEIYCIFLIKLIDSVFYRY